MAWVIAVLVGLFVALILLGLLVDKIGRANRRRNHRTSDTNERYPILEDDDD